LLEPVLERREPDIRPRPRADERAGPDLQLEIPVVAGVERVVGRERRVPLRRRPVVGTRPPERHRAGEEAHPRRCLTGLPRHGPARATSNGAQYSTVSGPHPANGSPPNNDRAHSLLARIPSIGSVPETVAPEFRLPRPDPRASTAPRSCAASPPRRS